MSWLDRFSRPKVSGLFRKPDIPHDLWEKCEKCEQMIFHRELESNLRVCPRCDHHMRLSADRRLALLFDEETYQTIELPAVDEDPLRFRDRKRYADRLREARSNTGHDDAIVVAHGKVGGAPAVVAAFDFGFLGGSMGTAVGESLLAAARLAILQKAPLIVIPSSGGATDAGRRALADADGAYHHRGRRAQGSGRPLHRAAHQPDDRRRHGLLRHARRHRHCGARRRDRIRRTRA